MPKLEVSMFERTNSTPPLYTASKPDKGSNYRPVTETKRAACSVIANNLMERIEQRIEAERIATEAAKTRAETAAKPYREFKKKLANPRIKRET